MTAAPQDQWRLLDVQAHDTRLAQLAHRRRTLPEHAEVERINGLLTAVGDRLVAARTVASDVGRELTKAEADVEQVRQRAARNQSRLDSGQGSAKDLQAIQHELQTLAQRQSVLEEAELEVMERLEAAQARVAEITAEQERLSGELADVIARRDRLVADLDDEATAERAARENSVAGLPADLLALYEKIRESAGGVGAARLYQRRCEGCRLELNTIDLGRIRAAAADTVVRCEECRRILVRTADSGL
ncbi:MAG TPA: C4-type zinc ribbon domain-containing protein [Kineosporiaceae bacterium]|nr:C4-type zinc ribbon domain-containing protein [Kineosporiaceae bacterium]